jgi:hypothetical protein
MTTPEAARLALWEATSDARPAVRDLAMLGAGLRGLGVAQRDAKLLELYRATFGERIDGVFDCPSCAGAVEVSLSVAELLRGSSGPTGWTAFDVDGYRVEVRPPDSADLISATEPGRPARELLTSRMVRAMRDGAPVPADALPAAVVGAALRGLAEQHPLIETLVATDCPWCGAPCGTLLDIGALLLAHVRADARRLLSEVDALARAYGWSEAQILALGERRRVAYLELVR